jgi:hypothetical protein
MRGLSLALLIHIVEFLMVVLFLHDWERIRCSFFDSDSDLQNPWIYSCHVLLSRLRLWG